MVDNSDGTYSVSYTPDEAGDYSVWVCVRAQHVQVRSPRRPWWTVLLTVHQGACSHTQCVSLSVGSLLVLQGSPFDLTVSRKWRRHSGTFHCCCFCSSGGSKEARCGCPGTMPGGAERLPAGQGLANIG